MTIAAAAAALMVQPQQGVPVSLLESVSLQPLEVAMALAAAGVPAGLELRQADQRPRSGPARVDLHGPRTSLDEVVAAFNNSQQEYTARLSRDGVVVIRPMVDAVAFLDEPSHIGRPAKVTGAMDAADLVFSAINPRLAGGVVLNRAADDTPIVLDGTGARTVIDTLNQIVLQTASRCWVVLTRHEDSTVRIAEYGFIEGTGAHRRRGLTYPDR